MKEIDGIIFDIRRFSIHDGPGVRTSVFFKGCPLHCIWCHNPESQDPAPEVMLYQNRCIGCTACVERCPQKAISISSQGNKAPLTDRTRCQRCGDCVTACTSDAREMVGRRYTVTEVMQEIRRDLPFFDESKGGVTISGGEPLYQPEFLKAILQACREEEIHTALDTSGFADWQTLDEVRNFVDLFLYDLKLMDEERHREYTGVSNQLILENLAGLAAAGHRIMLRIPLIPGVNDDPENIRQTALFALKLENLEEIDILPYHNMGFGKYNGLGKDYSESQHALSQQNSLSQERVSEIVKTLQNHHLRVKIV